MPRTLIPTLMFPLLATLLSFRAICSLALAISINTTISELPTSTDLSGVENIYPRCIHPDTWLAPSFVKDNCRPALYEVGHDEMEYGRQLFNFYTQGNGPRPGSPAPARLAPIRWRTELTRAILGTCAIVLTPLSVFAGGQVPQIGRRPDAVRGYASFVEVYAAAEGVHRFCANTGWVPLGIGQEQNLGLFVWAWNSSPDRYIRTLVPELAETMPEQD
ncbi:MAG: hypothetical protein Q9167_003325 [Letrouitia subvulpina]